jgi:hypothetical protein
LTTDTEYLHDVGRVSDVGAMLRTFTDRIPGLRPESWTAHVAGHPPGAVLVFVGLDRIGLPGGVPAALLCVLVGSSAGVAVAVTLRALGAEATARAAVPFGVLFPGAVWIGCPPTGSLLGCWPGGWRCWPWVLPVPGSISRPWRRPRLAGCCLAALCTCPMGWCWRVCSRWPSRLPPGGSFRCWWLAPGWPLWWLPSPPRVFGGSTGTSRSRSGITSREYGLERPYGYWVWADLACLAVVLGPAGVAGLRRVFTPGQDQPLVVVLLCGAAALAVLAGDLSGLSKAEVERIWLPFAVWLVAGAGLLPARQVRWWLGAQAVVALAVNHLLLTTW